jgi:hypothetical protein
MEIQNAGLGEHRWARPPPALAQHHPYWVARPGTPAALWRAHSPLGARRRPHLLPGAGRAPTHPPSSSLSTPPPSRSLPGSAT